MSNLLKPSQYVSRSWGLIGGADVVQAAVRDVAERLSALAADVARILNTPTSEFLGYNSNTSAALAAGTWTLLAIDSVVHDTGLEFNTTTSLFTAKRAGRYLVTGQAEFSKVTPAAANYIEVGVYKNGALFTSLGYYRLPVASAGNPHTTSINGTVVIPLMQGDRLGFYVKASHTNWTVSSASSTGTTLFGVTRVS